MKMSPYQREKKLKDKKKAVALYKQGLTLREIGQTLGRSYEWVRLALLDFKAVDIEKAK